jgi:hypothetical protein
VAWSTTSNIHAFVEAAGEFLGTRPMEHTVLLTEAAYLEARPSTSPDQLYGWWRDANREVTGAFVQAPRHPPIITDLPADAIEVLVGLLPDPHRIGVDGRLVDSVLAAWRDAGIGLAPMSRITLHRLRQLNRPWLPNGRARTAVRSDRDLLVSWYEQLMAAHPDDPSDLTYVVDDPLDYDGIVLWEVDGEPVAMAGRSRMVARMVRLGAVYQPGHGRMYADAAFVAACDTAVQLADHVLLFVAADDDATNAAAQKLGFEPVLDRVMLTS